MPNFKSFIKSLIFLFFILFSLILISNHSSYAAKKSHKTNPDLLTFNAYNNAPEKGGNIPAAISLKTALEIALKHYPGIMASKYSYISSIYTKNQSLYLYYPQISGNAGFSKNSVMDVNNSGQPPLTGKYIRPAQGE
jgi:hypothetical protein